MKKNKKHLMRKVMPAIILLGSLPISPVAQGTKTKPIVPSSNHHKRPTLMMGKGEQRILTLPGLKKYLIGQPSVLSSHPLPRDLKTDHPDSILLKGEKVGQTSLWFWNDDGSKSEQTVLVKPWNQVKRHHLHYLLEPLQETEVIPLGKGVLIRGTVHSPTEAKNIAAAVAGSEKIKLQIQLSPQLAQQTATQLKDWLRAPSWVSPDLTVQVRDQMVWVIGSCDERQKKLLQSRISQHFPLVQFEIDSLPGNQRTVYFRIYLLEIRRDEKLSFGINWPERLESSLQVGPTLFKNPLELDVALESLSKEGAVKILSRPELVVRTPGQAELFAGGELPIKNKGRYYSNVSWQPFGLTLKLNTTASTQQKVRLGITTEVSHLDHKIAAEDVPGLMKSRLNTQIDAHFGVPLFLSGLLQENFKKSAQGIPGLKDIPLLGALFGSQDFLNEKSELVALLIPSLKLPPSAIHRIDPDYPLGKTPPPRNWIAPVQIQEIKNHPDYPWNVL